MLLPPLIAGSIATILMIVSLYKAKKYKVDWLYLFGGGSVLHATAFLILSLNLPDALLLASPFIAIGTIMIVYSVMKILYWEEATRIVLIGVILGLAFIGGSAYSIYTDSTISMAIAGGAFMLLLPSYAFHTLFTLYKSSKDKIALVFAISFMIYALGSISVALLSSNVNVFIELFSMISAASYSLMLFSLLLA